jgi:hypothetical protein
MRSDDGSTGTATVALLKSDIGSHATAVGGECRRQPEGRARGPRSKRPHTRHGKSDARHDDGRA